MNLLHMKYAVEVAETGSINKAAERAYVGQSNLSRAIRELESSLGITIFDRSAKGMRLTADGELFMRYAKMVLAQVDSIEELFKNGSAAKKRFSISVPRASYIAEAFAKFSLLLEPGIDAEISYKETNAMRALKNITQEDYKLGIIRYASNYEGYYREMAEEKGLTLETVTQFRYLLVMNEKSPLASLPEIHFDDLGDLIEMAHGDPFVPSLPFSQVKKEELPDNTKRRILIFERASQFELLAQNPECFMWVSPIPKALLRRYGLIQRSCAENLRIYKDVLIRRRDYKLSELDELFVNELMKAKREVFEGYDIL